MKVTLTVIGCLLVVALFAFVIRGVSVGNYAFWAPIEQNVRRDVFENTNSYNRGKIQELSKYRIEYIRSETREEKDAISGVIRIQFADYPAERIEDRQLRSFLITIQGGN